jgi:hypothetical protein
MNTRVSIAIAGIVCTLIVAGLYFSRRRARNLNTEPAARKEDSPATNVDARPDRAELREALKTRQEWFKGRYDTLAGSILGPTGNKVYLGDKANRVCRYCGLAKPKTNFKKEAHAFPELVGNKWLIDYAECDACNGHFASIVEDHFGKWTLPWRSLGRIDGKSDIPSFKSNDKAFRIDAENARLLKIRLPKDDPRHTMDAAAKTAKFELERQPYVPMAVFKCMVKMALAIMPDEELLKCAHLKRWVLEPTHTFQSYPYGPLMILYEFAPGPLPNDRISYALFRRRADVEANSPYMTFALRMANHVFQIVLPMHMEDEKLLRAGVRFDLVIWPALFEETDHLLRYGRPGRTTFDMSGTSVVKGDVSSMTFNFDRMIEAPGSDATTGGGASS